MVVRVGFFSIFDENWAGGTYYLQSLIRSVYYSNVDCNILVFYNRENVELLNNFKYLENENVKLVGFSEGKDKITRLLNFIRFRLLLFRYDFYLIGDRYEKLIRKSKRVYWIGDLQNKVYPNYFDSNTLAVREKYQKKILYSKTKVIVTSQSMLKEVNTYYKNINSNLKVARFSSFVDIGTKETIESVELPYFYVPNQFWAHKNHNIIIEAVSELKTISNSAFQVIFTGKELDFRHAGFFESLKKKIEKFDGNKYFIFKGFVNRNEQIRLYKNSLCIIQPSFYEGWNTSIEDGKALQKLILASNLPVHKEQLESHGRYFNPLDAKDLAAQMSEILNDYYRNQSLKVVDCKYSILRETYSHEFYSSFLK